MDIPEDDIVSKTLDAAIRGQQVVQIRLENTWRTVEPYLMGLHRVTQGPVLYGYCRDTVPNYTTPSRWEIFHLDKVDSIELTSYSFLPHIDYKGRVESVEPVFRFVKPQLDGEVPAYWPVQVPHYLSRKIRLPR
ncbi:hypothetical protein GCM10028819_02760 [Spirosoma humi]